MSESFDSAPLFARRRPGRRRLRLWLMVAIPVAAILFQVYAPLFFGLLSYLELPLLVTIYLAMNRRSPVAGLAAGAAIGLTQDALSHWPVGMLGMVKTLAGYAASSLGLRLNTDNPAVRFGLGFVFFGGHQILFWALRRVLLNEAAALAPGTLFAAALVNGALAAPLFGLLDKLRESS